MLLFQNTNLQMWYRSTKTYAARTEDIITSLKCLCKTITSSFFFLDRSVQSQSDLDLDVLELNINKLPSSLCTNDRNNTTTITGVLDDRHNGKSMT